MPDIKVRVGQQNAVKVVASAFGGSLTAERAQYATNVTGGIASVTALDVVGITTLSGSLYVAGITTLAANGGITTTGGDFYVGRDLYVDQLNVTGVSTFGDDVVFKGASTNIKWDASENDLEFDDSSRLKFGDGDDLQIWHGGTHSFIKNSTGDLRIRGDKILLKKEDDSERYLEANANQDVKLFYNDSETFATISTGATVTGDLYVSGDLNVIGDLVYDEVIGRNLNITGLSTFVGITTQQSTLFATDVSVAGVTTFNGDVNFPGAAYHIHWDQPTSKFKFDDSAQCVWGSASGGDLRIWHASDTSNIKNETGELRIASNDLRLQTQNNSEDYLLAVDGGSVSIFHNDIKRLETTASGVDITNTLNVAGVSTFVGIVTTSSDLYVGGDLYIKDDLEFDEFTARNIKVTGVSTFVGDAQFDGNVSIGGTLTYEDVTNIDSVGLITARSGVRITSGGLVVTAGVSTFGADLTLSNADLTLSNGDISVSSGDISVSSGDLNVSGISTVGGNLIVGGELFVASNIRHTGDTDTYIEFTNDKIRLIAGGKSLIDATEAGTDSVTINDGGNDLDFRVEGIDDQYQIFSDGLTNKVGIGSAIPTAKLDVAGDLNVSGILTATQLTGLIDGGTY